MPEEGSCGDGLTLTRGDVVPGGGSGFDVAIREREGFAV
jgi:hypothetical protein